MIRKTLLELNTIFGKFDFESVPVFCNDKKQLCLSSCTSDGLLYVSAISNSTDNELKEFSFRNWAVMKNIVDSFYNKLYPDDFKVSIETNDDDYPSKLKVYNGCLSMTHYLQNYQFIERNDLMLEDYKKRKFVLNFDFENEITDFDEKKLKSLKKLSSMIGDDFIHLENRDDNLYFTFGEENNSVDSGKIMIQPEYTVNNISNELLFSVTYLYNIMNNHKDITISIKNDKMLFIADTDNFTIKYMLRAKK